MSKVLLNTTNHSRDSTGMRYVYPVLSRRAGGISIGINLNPNNACNWQCIYCQVPNLTRGGPPPIDLDLLSHELNALLHAIAQGQLTLSPTTMSSQSALKSTETSIQPGITELRDIAFSGNGEPTSAIEFPVAVSLVHQILRTHGLENQTMLRLITNGSLLDRKEVQEGIALIGQATGEVWFKVDRASPTALLEINGVNLAPQTVSRRLARCAKLAPTWVQTCLFTLDNSPPNENEIEQYLNLLKPISTQLKGVHLYSLARPSLQQAAYRLASLDQFQLNQIAQRIRQLGLLCTVSP